MKIEIELPDWVGDRKIFVFYGIEEIATRRLREPFWRVKTSGCNMCGRCCKFKGSNWPYGVKEVDGETWCAHLIFEGNEWRCDLRKARPFSCCITDHAGEDYCNIEWEKVEV